jgi:hypothetical protein
MWTVVPVSKLRGAKGLQTQLNTRSPTHLSGCTELRQRSEEHPNFGRGCHTKSSICVHDGEPTKTKTYKNPARQLTPPHRIRHATRCDAVANSAPIDVLRWCPLVDLPHGVTLYRLAPIFSGVNCLAALPELRPRRLPGGLRVVAVVELRKKRIKRKLEEARIDGVVSAIRLDAGNSQRIEQYG